MINLRKYRIQRNLRHLRIIGVKLILILSASILIGCSGFGHKTIPTDQFNFNNAINEASSEQLLLNMVRLRYSEQPTFLKVSSVINQYTRSANANASAGLSSGVAGNGGSAGIGGSWSNTPTITYLPISGKEFSQNLLTPLPPGALLYLIQSGWPIELVLKTAVWSINGVSDEVARPSSRRNAHPELKELIEIWQELSSKGIIGLKKNKHDNLESIELFINQNKMDQYEKEILRFKAILNLDTSLNSYTVKYGLIQEDTNEIVILTGSVWEIMLNLSWYFKAPEEQVVSGRTIEGFHAEDSSTIPPINIKFSKEKPEQSFIHIFHQDYWFYIDNNDRNSKRYFSFVQLILNLVENQTPNQAPTLALPTN
jgi:hypothetical protein